MAFRAAVAVRKYRLPFGQMLVPRSDALHSSCTALPSASLMASSNDNSLPQSMQLNRGRVLAANSASSPRRQTSVPLRILQLWTFVEK
jgi:hypothetical protein